MVRPSKQEFNLVFFFISLYCVPKLNEEKLSSCFRLTFDLCV